MNQQSFRFIFPSLDRISRARPIIKSAYIIPTGQIHEVEPLAVIIMPVQDKELHESLRSSTIL